MKALALVLVVGGCAPHAASGPAWPKHHDTGRDGGESLAPRENNPVAAAAAVEVDDEPVSDVVAPVAPIAPVAHPAEPAVTAPAVKSDDPLMTEDQVIEIDD
jgi:hypothetical protein